MAKLNKFETDMAITRLSAGGRDREAIETAVKYIRAMEGLLNEQFDQPDDDWGLSIFEEEK